MSENKFRDIGALFGSVDTPAAPVALPQPEGTETIVLLDPATIQPYPRHTFRSISEEEMQRMEDSIREHGVLHAAVVRLNTHGQHEMIAGHQRQQACINLGKKLPCVVRQIDDDNADIIMVDSNNQREISLFEKARSQRLKYEAMCRQGERSDLTGAEDAGKLSLEMLAEDAGSSASTIYRIIRLGYLNDTLLEMTEQKRIEQMGGVELSHLSEQSQSHISDYLLTHEKARLTKAQAAALRDADGKTSLTQHKVESILTKPAKQEKKKAVTLPASRIHRVLADKGLAFESSKDMIDYILNAVQAYEKEDVNEQTDTGTAESSA